MFIQIVRSVIKFSGSTVTFVTIIDLYALMIADSYMRPTQQLLRAERE